MLTSLIFDPKNLNHVFQNHYIIFCRCFDAGVVMRFLQSRGTRSIIVTSGTLAPMPHFLATVGMLAFDNLGLFKYIHYLIFIQFFNWRENMTKNQSVTYNSNLTFQSIRKCFGKRTHRQIRPTYCIDHKTRDKQPRTIWNFSETVKNL